MAFLEFSLQGGVIWAGVGLCVLRPCNLGPVCVTLGKIQEVGRQAPELQRGPSPKGQLIEVT